MRYLIVLISGLLLIGCNLFSQGTQQAIQATPTAIPSESSQEQFGNIIFWQSFPINEVTPAGDDIVIIEQIVLRRMESETQQTGNPLLDLEWTLNQVFESDNVWQGDDLTIESLSVSNGHAIIRLNGAIRGAGDIVLITARQQLERSVFEVAELDSFLMTLNGENIANLGISHDSQAQADDYAFTRDSVYGG